MGLPDFSSKTEEGSVGRVGVIKAGKSSLGSSTDAHSYLIQFIQLLSTSGDTHVTCLAKSNPQSNPLVTKSTLS